LPAFTPLAVSFNPSAATVDNAADRFEVAGPVLDLPRPEARTRTLQRYFARWAGAAGILTAA
jgi:hypothetical protein